MKKVNMILLAILAIACVVMAIFVVIWTRKVDKMMEEELNPTIVAPVQEEQQEETAIPVNNDAVDALQESFDSLLSWESIEELYEWETWFGFIGNVE